VLRLLAGQHEETRVIHSARTSTGSASLDEALRERAAGRDESAYEKLTVLLHKQPEQLDAALLMSDVARALGRHSAADAAMLRAIRIEAKCDETTAAVRHWLDLTEREIPREADAALLIRMATLLRHREHPRAASEALREALERATGSNTAPVATRIARAAQELDPTLAHDAAWRALGSPELTLEERQNLEDLLEVVMPRMPGAEVMLAGAWGENAQRPAAIEVETHTRVLDLVRATPIKLDDEGLHIASQGGAKKRVLFDRIDAVAVAAVQGISQKPILIMDLVLNWKETRETKLRVIRLRGDRFDPRRIVRADTALDAFRALLGTLLERSGATPLPDRDSALGSPFASFEQLSLYERTVLMAESSPWEMDD
jgi:tetratricopeptide (TPR) repeat protein